MKTDLPERTFAFAESTQGMSFSRSGVKIPSEKSPAKLYANMFLQGDPSDMEARIADLQRGRCSLDFVADDAKRLSRTLGASDRARLDQYYSAVRDYERQLEFGQEWERKPKPTTSTPAPKDITEKKKLIDRIRLMLQITGLAVGAERHPLARESEKFDFELRQLVFGISGKRTHRPHFSALTFFSKTDPCSAATKALVRQNDEPQKQMAACGGGTEGASILNGVASGALISIPQLAQETDRRRRSDPFGSSLAVVHCTSVFHRVRFGVTLTLLAPTAIHCGKKLVDQSVRGVDDMFGAWERAALDVADIVAETADSLCLDRLLHLVEVSILFCVSGVGRSVTAEDIFSEHELNVAAAAGTD